MRFKATFTDRGLQVLDKGFIPTLEKFGKTCHLLLSPDEVQLIQTTVNTDGSHVTARFTKEVLFDSETFKCESKHYNLIAFQLDLNLLQKVLKGAADNDAETMDVKLTLKMVPISGHTEQQSRPFLSFHAKGQSLSLVQDLPISRPMQASEIDRLVATKDVAVLCPFYVDLGPCTTCIQSMVDRMRHLGDTLLLVTAKNGDVHLQVSSTNITLGTQIRELAVYPQDITTEQLIDRNVSADQQLQAVLESQQAVAVYVQRKHVASVLQVQSFSQPSQILCGIAEAGAYVHLMFVYKDPAQDAEYDESVGLSFKLPVRDDT